MATVVSRLEAVLTAQTRDFDSAMTRSEGRMQKIGKVAGVAGLAIVGGLAYGLDKSVKAALAAQVSQSRLEVAFKTSGLSAATYAKQVDALESSGRKLGFTDEQTKTALGSLLIATHNMTKASADLSVAQDIARFKHVDLTQATKMLAMAMAGSQRATKQLGIDVPKVTTTYDALKASFGKTVTASEKLQLAQAKIIDKHKTEALVIDTVKQKLGGQAEAYSKTASGGMEQFHAQLDHLEVKMGTGLLPVLGKAATALSGLVDWFGKNKDVANLLVGGLVVLGGTLLTVSIATKAATAATKLWTAATKVATAAQWLLNVALTANPIGIVVLALAVLGVAFYEAYQHIKTFREGVNKAWDWIKNNWPLLLGILTGPIGLAVVEIIKHKDTLVRIFTNLPGQIADAFTAGYKLVKDAVTGLFHKVIHWVKSALGIASPSSVFYEIGKNSILGFIHGVGSMAGVLKDYVVHLAESVPGRIAGALGIGGSAPSTTSKNANVNLGRKMAAAYGWGGGMEFASLFELWQRESGWSNTAKNPKSGAYGIPQALPPTKMPRAAQEAGGSSAAAQIGWGLNYIKDRYGDPIRAWAHEQAAGWYDKGGWLPQGLSLALNTTGRPEPVGAAIGGGGTFNFFFPGYVGDESVVTAAVRDAMEMFQNRNGRPAYGGGF